MAVPSGPELIAKPEENGRLDNAVKGCQLVEKGPHFKEIAFLFLEWIHLTANETGECKRNARNVQNSKLQDANHQSPHCLLFPLENGLFISVNAYLVDAHGIQFNFFGIHLNML